MQNKIVIKIWLILILQQYSKCQGNDSKGGKKYIHEEVMRRLSSGTVCYYAFRNLHLLYEGIDKKCRTVILHVFIEFN